MFGKKFMTHVHNVHRLNGTTQFFAKNAPHPRKAENNEKMSLSSNSWPKPGCAMFLNEKVNNYVKFMAKSEILSGNCWRSLVFDDIS